MNPMATEPNVSPSRPDPALATIAATADHVDAGQSLDRGQLLHEALPLTEPDDAQGEGDRRYQHQALGQGRAR
jgi:hypothetical protein